MLQPLQYWQPSGFPAGLASCVLLSFLGCAADPGGIGFKAWAPSRQTYAYGHQSQRDDLHSAEQRLHAAEHLVEIGHPQLACERLFCALPDSSVKKLASTEAFQTRARIDELARKLGCFQPCDDDVVKRLVVGVDRTQGVVTLIVTATNMRGACMDVPVSFAPDENALVTPIKPQQSCVTASAKVVLRPGATSRDVTVVVTAGTMSTNRKIQKVDCLVECLHAQE